MFLGIANAISGIKSGGLSFIKDNLKLYLDFKSSRSDTLAFSSEGSTLFDGVNDRIDVSATLSSGTYTVMGWVYKTLQDGSYFVDFRKDSGTGYFAFSNNSNNSIYAQSGTLYVNGVAGTTVPLNTWTHICVNGMTIESSTTKIGCQNNDTNFFKGSMTNVALWNRELSIEEINSVMNKSYSQLGSVEKTSLVSWWALDSASNGVVQPATGETLGSNTFVSLDNFVTKSGGQVSVANNEVTLTIPTGGDSGMQIGNLAGFGISSSLGYADNDLAKISFEAKVVTNASGFGNTVRFKDNQGNVITNTDITLTTEYQTFTNYYVLTTVSGYRIPLLYRNGNRTGEDVQKFRNFSIEKVTSNTGFITGATTTTSVYGGNAPILPRAIDIAESFADKIGDGSALFAGGTSDEHIVTPKMSINFNSFSVSLWVKPVSFSSDDSFINIADTDSNDEEFLLYNKASANNQFSAFLPVPNTEYNSTYEIPTGEWSHLAFTKSGNTLKLYANGIEVHSGSCVNDNTYSRNLFIGARKQSSITLEMNSYIAGVGLWQGGLTQAQIQSVMESTSYAKIPADVKSTLGSDELPSPDLTSGTGLTIAQGSTGTLTHDTSAGTITATNDVQDGYLRWNSASLVENKLYKLEIVVDSYTGGRFRTTLGWNGTSFYPSVGTNIQYFIGSSTASFGIRIDDGNPAEFVISKISVKKVTNDLVGYWALDADNSIPALSFDGSNDYINFGNNSSLQFSGSFSIGCWFKTTDASSSNEHLFSKSNGGADAGFGLMLDSSRKIKFIYHQSGENDSGFSSTDVTDSGSAINDGEWHHVMGVYTSGSKIELFKDGASIGSSTSNVGVLPSHVPNLFIGGRDAGNKQVHACEVSSASAYNVAKSASEILAMYNDGIDKDESSNSGLVGYWKMDNGTTVSDLSSNSNNGTVNGATLIENAVALDSTSNNNDGSLN